MKFYYLLLFLIFSGPALLGQNINIHNPDSTWVQNPCEINEASINDGKDENTSDVPSGVYFLIISTKQGQEVLQIVKR